MTSTDSKVAENKPTEDLSIEVSKKPYVKPELHLLDLDSTEGKTKTAASEFTNNGRNYGAS